MDTGFAELVILFVIILFSISIHEAMHAYVAHWQGDDTAYQMGRLTLNPFRHIDPLTTLALPIMMALAGLPPLAAAKPVVTNPAKLRDDEYGMAMVGIAGPLTNLALAAFAGLWLRFVVSFDAGLASYFFETTVVLNIGLFVFNMIPYPPLDGSRLLFAFAPQAVRNVMRSIERTGILGFIIFFLVIFQILLPFIYSIMNILVDLIIGVPLDILYSL